MKLHARFLIQYTFERHPAQVFRMVSGQCRQLFDCQIVIDSDHVPRMDHSAVPKTYAAMSPVDRAVFAWTQAVIKHECASLRNSALQRVLVQLTGFLCGISAEYFDMIADFKCVLDTCSSSALTIYIPLLPTILQTAIILFTIAQRSPDN